MPLIVALLQQYYATVPVSVADYRITGSMEVLPVVKMISDIAVVTGTCTNSKSI